MQDREILAEQGSNIVTLKINSVARVIGQGGMLCNSFVVKELSKRQTNGYGKQEHGQHRNSD